jgi:hypothetical protein
VTDEVSNGVSILMFCGFSAKLRSPFTRAISAAPGLASSADGGFSSAANTPSAEHLWYNTAMKAKNPLKLLDRKFVAVLEDWQKRD